MPVFETIETNDAVVACNGSGGALGHPRVFLNLAPTGRIECPYCSRVFVNPRLAAHGGTDPEHGGGPPPLGDRTEPGPGLTGAG